MTSKCEKRGEFGERCVDELNHTGACVWYARQEVIVTDGKPEAENLDEASEAMTKVIEALRPLNNNQRVRVMETVKVFLSVEAPLATKRPR